MTLFQLHPKQLWVKLLPGPILRQHRTGNWMSWLVDFSYWPSTVLTVLWRDLLTFPVFMYGAMSSMTIWWYNICVVKFVILGPTLTPVEPITARGVRYTSVTLLTSSSRTKIAIIYTQVLQEEKTFTVIHRSEWLGQLSAKYARKCSELRVKIIYLNYSWLLLVRMCQVLFN